MDIKKHYQSLINQIKAEEEREIQAIKIRVMSEKITPYNNEMEKLKVDSIAKRKAELDEEKAKLLTTYNENVAALQQAFDEDKKLIEQTIESKKNENYNSVISSETYEITKKAQRAVSDINNLIDKIKE